MIKFKVKKDGMETTQREQRKRSYSGCLLRIE